MVLKKLISSLILLLPFLFIITTYLQVLIFLMHFFSLKSGQQKYTINSKYCPVWMGNIPVLHLDTASWADYLAWLTCFSSFAEDMVRMLLYDSLTSCCFSWALARDLGFYPCPWGLGVAGACPHNPGCCTVVVGLQAPSERHKKTCLHSLVSIS